MIDKFDKAKYDKEFHKSYYDRITVNVSKDSMLKSRLETLAISTNKSKDQLIIEAIERLLQDNDL